MVETTIIGIDCATDDAKVGLALAVSTGECCELIRAYACPNGQKVDDVVMGWLNGPDRVLLALDAPLGWPRPLARALYEHRAGDVLPTFANELFRRKTDQDVRKRFGKQSLDVGADRIARTAHSALALLGRLRQMTGCAIPLAWEPTCLERIAAIEVYPAATLIAHGLQVAGYKKPDSTADREAIVGRLGHLTGLPEDPTRMVDNADALDAAICVLAGHDFLRGNAIPPDDPELARHEGWIWVRQREFQ